jgi:hypothetical protein
MPRQRVLTPDAADGLPRRAMQKDASARPLRYHHALRDARWRMLMREIAFAPGFRHAQVAAHCADFRLFLRYAHIILMMLAFVPPVLPDVPARPYALSCFLLSFLPCSATADALMVTGVDADAQVPMLFLPRRACSAFSDISMSSADAMRHASGGARVHPAVIIFIPSEWRYCPHPRSPRAAAPITRVPVCADYYKR